jgi:sugar O-acyltransferase (sialic acid O-acetyltransferase NeuD family)
MTRIVLLGGGGHARACLDVAESAGHLVAGFVAPSGTGASPGFEWLGTDSEIERLAAQGFRFIVAIGHMGDHSLRAGLWDRICGFSTTLESPRAAVSPRASVGTGTVVFHHCHIGPGVSIGVDSILNTAAVVEHDAVLGDHVHISTRAVVNGGCEVGAGAFLGSGSIILEGRKIGAAATVGAGAVVTCDIPDGGTWVGVPARRIA